MTQSTIILVFTCNSNYKYTFTHQYTKANRTQKICYDVEISKDKKWKKSRPIYCVKRGEQQIYPIVDNPLVELIRESTSIGQNLSLQINEQGELKRLLNLKEIQYYWQRRLNVKIESQYEGLVVANMVKQLEVLVENETLFVEKLKKDVFFNHYCGILYGSYHYDEACNGYVKQRDQAVEGVFYLYKIQLLKNKGIKIKGVGKQSKEQLNTLRELWDLDGDVMLTYEGIVEGELNEQHEIVKLRSSEVYTYGKKPYCSTVVNLDLS